MNPIGMASPTNNGTDTFVGENNSSGFNWSAFGVAMTIVGICSLCFWNCCLTNVQRHTARMRIAAARTFIFGLAQAVWSGCCSPAFAGLCRLVQAAFTWLGNQYQRLRGGGVAGPPVPAVVPQPGGAAVGAQGPGMQPPPPPPQGQAPAGGGNPFRVPPWLQNRRFWHNQPAANFPVIPAQVQLQQQHQGLQQVVVHGGQQQQQPPQPVVAAGPQQQPGLQQQVPQQVVVAGPQLGHQQQAQQPQPQQQQPPLQPQQQQQQQPPPQQQPQQQRARRGGGGGRGGGVRRAPPPPPQAAAGGAQAAANVGVVGAAAVVAPQQVNEFEALDKFLVGLEQMELNDRLVWDDSYDTLLLEDYPTFANLPPPPSEYCHLFFEGSDCSASSTEGF